MQISTHVLIPLMLVALSTADTCEPSGDDDSSPSPGAASIAEILEEFSPYDLNDDGVNEIDDLYFAAFEESGQPVAHDAALVLVLVEPRLLEPITGSALTEADLSARLEQYKADLYTEGLESQFVLADAYDGSRHQDGRTVLAIRELLRRVRESYPNLQGVVLVGAFPDPNLVRRWVWRRQSPNDTINGQPIGEKDFLRIVPENVAQRADLVLADLDGRWESLYQEGPVSLESIKVVPDESVGENWPQDGQVITSSEFEISSISFSDFFWIRDDRYQILEQTDNHLEIEVYASQQHPELSDDDLEEPNPIARPEISISRVNALHVGHIPDPSFVDDDGDGFLGPDGKPQTVRSAAGFKTSEIYVRDPAYERKLLVDYFDRNHGYRLGENNALPFRVGAIAYEFSAAGMASYMDTASVRFDAPVVVEDATLVDYVRFYQRPAFFRGIEAHSSPWNTAFSSDYLVADLEAAAGGHPWRWKHVEGTDLYEPSFADQGGAADLYLHQTLYENGVLDGAGYNLFVHGGCDVNTPNASGQPYTYPSYGDFQNAEGQLFFLNGVALIARAKEFNDLPTDFPASFGETPTSDFGSAWKETFTIDSQDVTLAQDPAATKKTYWWGLLGDWTARLRYADDSRPLTQRSGRSAPAPAPL